MALIKCQKCEKEISDKARICPHCNFKVTQKAKINSTIFTIGIEIILFIILIAHFIIIKKHQEKFVIGNWVSIEKSSANGGTSYDYYKFNKNGTCNERFSYELDGKIIISFSNNCNWKISHKKVNLSFEDEDNTIRYLEIDFDNNKLYELEDNDERKKTFQKYN